MYGLPQSGKLSNELLTSRLNKFIYFPYQYTQFIWHNKWRPIVFSLVVGDFGVKYEGIQHSWHLEEALNTYHEVSVYWEGIIFCGVSLDWNYKGKMFDFSMIGYISKALIKYQHHFHNHTQHQPYKSTPIQYGAKVQNIVELDTYPPLTKYQIKHVQDNFGTLLYYG